MAKKKPDLAGAEAEQPGTDEVPAPEEPEMAPKRRRTPVAHEELVPGTVLTASLKGENFSASVVLGDEGKPEVEFDGARYPSVSAAGKAAAGYPVNGWRFWRPVEQPQE